MAYRGKSKYRSGYKKKRYTRGKSTWRTYLGKSMSLAGKAGIKYLRSRLGLNTESKWLDTLQSGLTLSGTAQLLTNATVIPEGDTANTRNGDSVRLTHYKTKFLISANTSQTVTYQVRVIFWHQPVALQGTQLTASQILQDSSDILSPYNMDTEGYKVLYDKTFMLLPQNVGKGMIYGEFHYAPTDHHLKWITADTGGLFTNLTHGVIRGMVYSTGASNFPVLTSYTRINYVDN